MTTYDNKGYERGDKMILGISPYYAQLTRRFIVNVGTISRAKISADTGISVEALNRFSRSGTLDPESVIRLWSVIFPDSSFLEAARFMDSLGFSWDLGEGEEENVENHLTDNPNSQQREEIGENLSDSRGI